LTRAEPFAGAVQRHQTERPAALPAWFGSPGSLVASALIAETNGDLRPSRSVAFSKSSFAGRCCTTSWNWPISPRAPSTAMR
jgi:hypothetical protein